MDVGTIIGTTDVGTMDNLQGDVVQQAGDPTKAWAGVPVKSDVSKEAEVKGEKEVLYQFSSGHLHPDTKKELNEKLKSVKSMEDSVHIIKTYGINVQTVHTVMQDKDGNIYIK